MTRSKFSVATRKAALERCLALHYDMHRRDLRVPCCEACGQPFNSERPEFHYKKEAYFGERPEFHHKKEAYFGGKDSNSLENCLVVHKRCHKLLTAQQSVPVISKTQRLIKKNNNTAPPTAKIRSQGFQKRWTE